MLVTLRIVHEALSWSLHQVISGLPVLWAGNSHECFMLLATHYSAVCRVGCRKIYLQIKSVSCLSNHRRAN